MHQPTPQELQEAIDRHTKRAAERVAKIPWDQRTILSIFEVEEYQQYMDKKASNERRNKS